MTVPDGLPQVDENGADLVCKLQRGIYGLASSGRLWSDELCAFMKSQGFKRAHGDPALYHKGSGADTFLVSSHVDDLLMAAKREHIEAFLVALKAANIEVSAQAELHFLLNMQVKRDRANKTVTLHQAAYTATLLENFGMSDALPLSTPMTPGVKLSDESDDKLTGTRETGQRGTTSSWAACCISATLFGLTLRRMLDSSPASSRTPVTTTGTKPFTSCATSRARRTKASPSTATGNCPTLSTATRIAIGGVQ